MSSETNKYVTNWTLQQKCDWISKVYGLLAGAITIVTYSQQGDDTVVQWRYAILHNHQKGYFLEGLKKLGIDPDRESPAVVAAKYHYFSNALGGLDMEMLEESPKKAWIRYNAPFGPAGTGWLAIPPRMGRAIFAGWHPFNAVRLDEPRLGFVVCKAFTDGEPYAEGYFKEYDHDLTEEERLQFDPAATMPEFDAETAPKLDSEVWPPDRKAKAKRNFGRGYVEESISALLQLLGTPVTAQIVKRAFEGIAIQYGKELLADLNIEGNNAISLANFAKALSDMAGDTVDLISPAPDKHILRTTHRRIFKDVAVPMDVHKAMFGFIEMMGKIIGPRIKVSLTALQDDGSPYDEIMFEDLR